MKRLIAAVALAVALVVPAAVAAGSGDSCPDPAEFAARYGFTPQVYVEKVAVGELTLAAEKASIAAVASGAQTIDRWSSAYGEQMGLPTLKYGDLYFQARMVEFRDGGSFEAAQSYLGNESGILIGCGFVDGEAVRASLQGVEAAVIADVAPVPVVSVPSPRITAAIAKLRHYIAVLSRPGAHDPDGHLALYRARLAAYLAR